MSSVTVMPTPEHEIRHLIFTKDQDLFARSIRRVLSVEVPAPVKASELNIDMTEIRPIERRGDTVLLMEVQEEGPDSRYVVVVESQTERDEDKRSRWPYLIAYLHDKYQCPVVLLVTCSKRATATWAREPIQIGLPGLICLTLTPVVFGPDNVPAITSLEEACADAWFTILSAITHGRSAKLDGILEVLAVALNTLEPDTAATLAEFTEIGLGETAGREKWRALLSSQTYPYMSQLRAEGIAEGEARGEARAVVRVLKSRGICMTAAERDQILSCADIPTLDRWLDRVWAVTTITELFADEADEQIPD